MKPEVHGAVLFGEGKTSINVDIHVCPQRDHLHSQLLVEPVRSAAQWRD